MVFLIIVRKKISENLVNNYMFDHLAFEDQGGRK